MKGWRGYSSRTWDGRDRWYQSRNRCPATSISRDTSTNCSSVSYLRFQQREQSSTKQRLSIEGRSQMVRIVTTGGHISHPQKGTESIIVQAISGKEVLVELVTRASPEVTNLLGLDVTWSERRALQWRSGDLQDWKRRSIGRQWLCDARNRRNKWRQGQTLRKGDQACRRSQRVLHLDFLRVSKIEKMIGNCLECAL
jgi:hypothetical protein